MKRYNTCEEIRKDFIRQGWSEEITFCEVDLEKGKKFFKMIQTGNIFDNHGKIYIYNITDTRNN
jgi:hypothetical protein